MGGAVAAAAEGGEAVAAAAEGGEAAAAAAEGGEAAAAEGGEAAAAEGGEAAAAEGGEAAAAEGGEAAAAEGGEAGAAEGAAAEGGEPPPNEVVVDDDPAANLQLEENQENVGAAVDQANEIPAEDKVSTWKDVAKSVWGVTKDIVDIAFKAGNMAFMAMMIADMEKGDKSGAAAAGAKAGLTPDQVLQFNENISVWLNLSTPLKWQRLSNLMSNVNFTSDQQTYLINWLYQAFSALPNQATFTWPASAVVALVKTLAKETPDANMYAYMETYKYNNDYPPFDVGLNCVLMALSVKYPAKKAG
ncbi:hypothetical protein ACFOY5_03910 [Massilia aurea]|jgi:hypothetical protein|uniref:hypothetical protein n=1 Tax=Massilia aurea TaxID=373040 RepID=UPI0021612A4D|nr:hypothetical protein [Massilia aurea]MCS0707340.1 hypothetical protein [Massilia aurea]